MTTTPSFDDPDVAGESATATPGDLVTQTVNAPWGSSIQYGRVIAVGTPEGATSPQVQVEWFATAPSGPMDPATLEPYVPQV